MRAAPTLCEFCGEDAAGDQRLRRFQSGRCRPDSQNIVQMYAKNALLSHAFLPMPLILVVAPSNLFQCVYCRPIRKFSHGPNEGPPLLNGRQARRCCAPTTCHWACHGTGRGRPRVAAARGSTGHRSAAAGRTDRSGSPRNCSCWRPCGSGGPYWESRMSIRSSPDSGSRDRGSEQG